MRRLIFFTLISLFCACSTDRAKISGEFANCEDENVYLEQITFNGNIVIDSTTMNDNNSFKFSVELPEGEATLYNVRCSDEAVTLLLSKGDDAKIHYVSGLLGSYIVDGSKESKLIKEISDIMVFGAARLDSIRNVYSIVNLSEKEIKTASRAYMTEVYKTKRQQIAFIIQNSSSLAAIYALSQRLPNENTLFIGKNDIVYYRLVADSVEKNYPTSPYLKGLKATIEQVENQNELVATIDKAIENAESFPNIIIDDMYGEKQELYDHKERVILLDFWSIADKNALFNNADLKQLYKEYNEKGFSIYQVSVDTSEPVWIDVVQKQKLPWVSVCDFRGALSLAVKTYNVSSAPSNFLIDGEGNIVAKNIYGKDLTKKVAELMKNHKIK